MLSVTTDNVTFIPGSEYKQLESVYSQTTNVIRVNNDSNHEHAM